jgi:formylglycine-generating enzyme required for sulfatase activity
MVTIVEQGSTATFLMGSTEEEIAAASGLTQETGYRTDNENPAHEVTLTVPYEIGVYEVTNEQYAEVMSWAIDQGDAVIAEGLVTDPSGTVTLARVSRSTDRYLDQVGLEVVDGRVVAVAGKEDNPVSSVTWYGALAYANALSEIEGLTPAYDPADWSWDQTADGYRLPTEAEWEYAARGPERWMYAWGNTADPTYVSSGRTMPVGYFDGSEHDGFQTHSNASPFGLYDMTGNVWEWCWDWYGLGYYAVSPATDPTGPEVGDENPPYDRQVATRVWRGAGLYASVLSGFLRVAKRWSSDPADYYSELGFRVARTLD